MFTIIPAKPFRQSKTRLAASLSGAQRVNLSRRLLLRTIYLARQVGNVVVVSRSQAVRQVAKTAGAWALVEMGIGLNTALEQSIAWVSTQNSQAALIIPADLPLLTLADLSGLISVAGPAPAVVIAPCRHGTGTNALLLKPPGIIALRFGPNSFQKHQEAVSATGLNPIIYHSATIGLDLDTPEDLSILNAPYLESLALET
jgi:2-phospho-L-lactate guanylyltransferase